MRYFLFAALLSGATALHAQMPFDELQSFQYVTYVGTVSTELPVVVEVPMVVNPEERSLYAVMDERGFFVPHLLMDRYRTEPVRIAVESGSSFDAYLTDENPGTSVEYAFLEETSNAVSFRLSAERPIRSSALIVELDRWVSLPTTVRLSVLNSDGTERIVLAETPMMSTVIQFPETTAKEWTLKFTYAQPLRVSELRLLDASAVGTMTRGLRFLAQPGASYRIFHGADRYVSIPTEESGDLSRDEDVLYLAASPSERNPAYRMADADADGVFDIEDNCVQVSNGDQIDVNRNGRGDACEDLDRDGLLKHEDNCPNLPNRGQEDTDGDEIGDACDGEESRLTEKYAWIPWAGMGIALLVLIILFALVATSKNERPPVA